MHIHDADRFALLVVGRRCDKREPEPCGNEKSSQHPERRDKTRRQRHEARRIGIGMEPLGRGKAAHARHLARRP
jgi:hypothetical protein